LLFSFYLRLFTVKKNIKKEVVEQTQW